MPLSKSPLSNGAKPAVRAAAASLTLALSAFASDLPAQTVPTTDMSKAARAAQASYWTSSWTASPQPVWGPDFPFPTNVPQSLEDKTVRQVARISLGGKRMQIALSNAYGTQPLTIGAAEVALAGPDSTIEPGSARALTFGGEASATIPPGAPLLSDPVELETPDLARVSVSVYLPKRTPISTFHWEGRQTSWIAPGNQVGAARIDSPENTSTRLLLSAIQVERRAPAPVVVVIGDSLTDGAGATTDRNTRWPDFLAARLAPHEVAVINAGISGARLLSDRMGVNALSRFDRDVLGQPGVQAVIVGLGLNDIGWPGTVSDPEGGLPALQDLIAGYRQLINRAHQHGVRIIGATLTPFEGAFPGTPMDNYYRADKDELRQRLNDWIRHSGAFDAVIDFDALVRDPRHPSRLKAEWDSGDHLHPGDEGNRAMAEAVDLPALLSALSQ